ncbi:putative malate dehydrogenase 1B [Amyelois transitella]|uniref:putative malate dehydrogenase 1B n=1 Tax=Amyelois transitella TaxID=680683 RepID=UPI00067BFE73|nr:putative malate dehydrogenase 1B [Amyelois transitella]
MVVRIVISGESQCELFAEMCLVADHLAQNLPDFCYERLEKKVHEWQTWLSKINQKNNWHHQGSPLIWKELLRKGSKAYYIGGASEFLDYCHSYYNFEKFMTLEKFGGLVNNYKQYQTKVREDNQVIAEVQEKQEIPELPPKSTFYICISGAGCPMTKYLIMGLLKLNSNNKSIAKIFINDSRCATDFMEYVEEECSYISTVHPGKVVKYIEKIGLVLSFTDLLIILDHVPFDPELAIGDWLHRNKHLMEDIAVHINVSASRKMYTILPNLGPACYNATILMNATTSINKHNIVVVTSDLGLDILQTVAEISEVPMKNIYCPPVWGFVGINHLVDVRTTIHKYNSFEPYNRYVKVRNSSLNIGSLTPEMRTMEYLMYFDETLWKKQVEIKMNIDKLIVNKALAVLDVLSLWLFDPEPNFIFNLGVRCNGSFGLTFEGAFSQPARFKHGEWRPAKHFPLPKDPNMNLKYLEDIANLMMTLKKTDLPKLNPYTPCTCKPKYFKKKEFRVY